MTNIRVTPFKIKYGNMKMPKYYCRKCLKRVKKKEKVCKNCFSIIDWEEYI